MKPISKVLLIAAVGAALGAGGFFFVDRQGDGQSEGDRLAEKTCQMYKGPTWLNGDTSELVALAASASGADERWDYLYLWIDRAMDEHVQQLRVGPSQTASEMMEAVNRQADLHEKVAHECLKVGVNVNKG